MEQLTLYNLLLRWAAFKQYSNEYEYSFALEFAPTIDEKKFIINSFNNWNFTAIHSVPSIEHNGKPGGFKISEWEVQFSNSKGILF